LDEGISTGEGISIRWNDVHRKINVSSNDLREVGISVRRNDEAFENPSIAWKYLPDSKITALKS
jgi:hypothetical protein